ncbi:hypothetical protein BL250_06465 [Erwinia sp. OLTSP20]|uniref:DUF2498 family protein n=1 Tax=unclassified Erwinia TaxID=2622719 RepID=UPI000C19C487|nr:MULTISPECIES: DUF2498 family protein [unclassified Erwinia]PIJ51803.1 hypothetical protein BV501_02370 [Erwinia sp. OAMSP11]PIJ74391.1 hypothetical protein BK416_04300 [Erwinia sp. OLSSP12]PIJ83776.1 hypothetical protein BLD47_03825 [Erwinia sp. OLCASP19]PIJ86819.1 hypothetical protein BLD46_02320 [Erwinia sp. OLMTSP26]PIJ88226.1 hypothetical protein BLD49_03000 [Erwinia sp. OLMDSP33]
MTQSQQTISAAELLIIANGLLQAHADYLAGVQVSSVKQQGDLLIFSGDFYPDNQGLPTAKSTVVFNLFKYLTTTLSAQYRLR